MRHGATALIASMTSGFVVLIAVLVLALAGGAVWRRTNGRMRITTREPEPALADAADLTTLLTGTQLGHELGERATLVQFSSAFCAPCRATRRILADVAAMTQGVAHVEIDAESRLDLVRQLNVLRTPTVLVLASDGRIVRRASGQPRKPDVIAAIGAAVGI
jgi:thiol-disulfide isomerase/thioredoxin